MTSQYKGLFPQTYQFTTGVKALGKRLIHVVGFIQEGGGGGGFLSWSTISRVLQKLQQLAKITV